MAIAISHNTLHREKQTRSKLNPTLLRNLIQQRRMSISSLSHKTGIPRATMRRFINGCIQRPHFQIIQDVSKCLNMDMNCLFAVSKKSDALDRGIDLSLSPNKVPVLEWGEIEQWVSRGMDRMLPVNRRWINANRPLSPQAFALKSTAVMESYLPTDSTVIINPKGQIEDQKLVLVFFDILEPTIYKAIAYESGFYLKPLLEEGNTKRLIRLTSETSIIGTLEEAVTFL